MEDFENLTSQLVKVTYAKQGTQNIRTRQKHLELLLRDRRLPAKGFSDPVIEFVIQQLSVMDSNNFESNCGVGEREGRIYSRMVSERHFSLSHGIGRSGNITEEQPKAAGSSIIYKLTTSMAAHALEMSGFKKPVHCLLLPFATGMSITMCILTLKIGRPAAKYVIWSRIDQKSCFKSIITAGLSPLVVDNIIVDGQMQTDVARVRDLLELHRMDVLCVLTTTSCFAPRQPDLVDDIARLCKSCDVGHIINNAYGLQCPLISKLINRAVVVGRVDAVVQSSDKNFMVPVGGAIISCPGPEMISQISMLYPGRASISPILDLFITFLSMGEEGLQRMWKERQRLVVIMTEKLKCFAQRRGERIIESPRNSISIGVTLDTLSIKRTISSDTGDDITARDNAMKSSEGSADDGLQTSNQDQPSATTTNDASATATATVHLAEVTSSSLTQPPSAPPIALSEGAVRLKTAGSTRSNTESISFLGSMLFQRNVSGCRVVPQSDSVTVINEVKFISWGAHMSHYPVSYFTAACSIGLTEDEIILFIDRIDRVWKKFERKSVLMTDFEESELNCTPVSKNTRDTCLSIESDLGNSAKNAAHISIDKPVQEYDKDNLN